VLAAVILTYIVMNEILKLLGILRKLFEEAPFPYHSNKASPRRGCGRKWTTYESFLHVPQHRRRMP
jgi:hypothetical protein